jgi:Mrp family chromosome partitioning ATPase
LSQTSLSQTSWLNASTKLAFQAAAAGGEVLLVHADTYGGAVAHATMQEPHTKEGQGARLG